MSVPIPAVDPNALPEGSTYWDVEGIPVAFVPMPDGGLDTIAFDGAEPRRFPGDSVYRNGAVVSPEAFDRLRATFGQTSKPDLVGALADRTEVNVLGFDGFAAKFRGGTWSRAVVGDFFEPDMLAVRDPVEIAKFSTEARTVLSSPQGNRAVFGKDPMYWDVDGVPVAAVPMPDGSIVIRAYDVPGGRLCPFTLGRVREDGTEISAAKFGRLQKRAYAALSPNPGSLRPGHEWSMTDLRWIAPALLVVGVSPVFLARHPSDGLLTFGQLALFVDLGFLFPLWWVNEYDRRWRLLAACIAVPSVIFSVVGLVLGF